MWLLRLFGGASLEDASGPLIGRAAQRRRLALLAILALEHPRPVSRDRLIACLWPETGTERARHLLRDSVYLLRGALGEDAVTGTGDELSLNPQRLHCDVWEFQEALAEDEPQRGVERYAGPLLDGFHPDGSVELEHWLDSQRERLARAYAEALEQVAETASAGIDRRVAVCWWRRLAAVEPHNARVALRLMQALEAAGDRAGALQHARVHALLLEQEFGARPDPEVVALAEALRNGPADQEHVTARPADDPAAEGSPAAAEELSAPRAGVATQVDTVLPQPPDRAPRSPRLWSGWRSASRAMLLPAWAGLGLAGVLTANLLFRGLKSPVDAAADAAMTPSTAIAVLPCANLSGDPEQEYISDGLTEELTGVLSQVHSLRVVARTSAFAFKGESRDIREVADLLNVGTVLECSVRRAGDRVRVTAQLINAQDGFHMWAETYEREGTDLFAIQSDLALRIARALEAELTPIERARMARRPTESRAAHTLYQKGRFFWNQRTSSGYARAIEYYEQAIEADPGYAEAYAGLATVYSMQGIFGALSPADATERTREYALKALQIDPDIAEAHTVLGGYYQAHVWDSEAAEREHLRALELDPNYSTAHFWYGNYLTAMRRFEEALEHKRMAVDLDPLSPQLNWSLGLTLMVAGRPAEALEQFRNAIELDSSYYAAYAGLGMAYESMGRWEDALLAHQRMTELVGGAPNAGLARVLARVGRQDEARAMLLELEARAARTGIYDPSVATVLEALGEVDEAISWLERSYQQRHPSLRFMDGPGFDRLEQDPRYRNLRRRIGLPVGLPGARP